MANEECLTLDVTLDSLLPNKTKKRGKKRKARWTKEEQEEWKTMSKEEKKAWWAENKKKKQKTMKPKAQKKKLNTKKVKLQKKKKNLKAKKGQAQTGVDISAVQKTIDEIKGHHKRAETKKQKQYFSKAIANLVQVIKPLREN